MLMRFDYNVHQYVSKVYSKFHVKIIYDDVRAAVYQISIPLDLKVVSLAHKKHKVYYYLLKNVTIHVSRR